MTPQLKSSNEYEGSQISQYEERKSKRQEEEQLKSKYK